MGDAGTVTEISLNGYICWLYLLGCINWLCWLYLLGSECDFLLAVFAGL